MELCTLGHEAFEQNAQLALFPLSTVKWFPAVVHFIPGMWSTLRGRWVRKIGNVYCWIRSWSRKSKMMTYTLKRNPVKFDYQLQRANNLIDLGVIMDINLSFRPFYVAKWTLRFFDQWSRPMTECYGAMDLFSWSHLERIVPIIGPSSMHAECLMRFRRSLILSSHIINFVVRWLVCLIRHWRRSFKSDIILFYCL